MRNGDEQGAVVNRVENFLGRDAERVLFAPHQFDGGAAFFLRMPEIEDGRELFVGHNHLSSLAFILETGGYDRLGGGDVDVERGGPWFCANNRRNLVGQFLRHHPPFFFPRAHTARFPDVGVGGKGLPGRAGHSSE